MKHCPITYEDINKEARYSLRGLKLLSPQLTHLSSIELSAAEQRAEGLARVGKMSIQGIQSKFSAILKIKEGRFEIVDQHGQYILKPQSEHYPELPENEALTMTLAAMIGVDVPIHGMAYSKDNSMTYFIKRFDREGKGKKIPLEDFAQLTMKDRDTKYSSSMEKVAKVLYDFCSFPQVEAVKLLKLTLFNFLIGNEDMHLKNFSLISDYGKVTLSPAYDLLNSTIAQRNTQEELALPLNGKKSKLNKRDFIDYYAYSVLKLNANVVTSVIREIQSVIPNWIKIIKKSFLTQDMQENYLKLLDERRKRLDM
jgi:serine/threonine-protein kinase HipA